MQVTSESLGQDISLHGVIVIFHNPSKLVRGLHRAQIFRLFLYADESCLLEVHIYSTSDDQKIIAVPHGREYGNPNLHAPLAQEFPWLKEIAAFSDHVGRLS